MKYIVLISDAHSFKLFATKEAEVFANKITNKHSYVELAIEAYL